ncbi:hypothetical protein MMC21_001312 [Puttea exsequens]|nr:hypothetical protein [Puttea exsequens]
MTNLRRRVHGIQGFVQRFDNPLPNLSPFFRFEDVVRPNGTLEVGLKAEEGPDSIWQCARNLIEVGLITVQEHQKLIDLTQLVAELWFHSLAEYHMRCFVGLISISANVNDWSGVGLTAERFENSLFGVTEKLRDLALWTEEDEEVLMMCVMDLTNRWACCDVRPTAITPQPFSSQSDEIDALLDSRTKLARIHILASDDEVALIPYHIYLEAQYSQHLLEEHDTVRPPPIPDFGCSDPEEERAVFREWQREEYEMISVNDPDYDRLKPPGMPTQAESRATFFERIALREQGSDGSLIEDQKIRLRNAVGTADGAEPKAKLDYMMSEGAWERAAEAFDRFDDVRAYLNLSSRDRKFGQPSRSLSEGDKEAQERIRQVSSVFDGLSDSTNADFMSCKSRRYLESLNRSGKTDVEFKSENSQISVSYGSSNGEGGSWDRNGKAPDTPKHYQPQRSRGLEKNYGIECQLIVEGEVFEWDIRL